MEIGLTGLFGQSASSLFVIPSVDEAPSQGPEHALILSLKMEAMIVKENGMKNRTVM